MARLLVVLAALLLAVPVASISESPAPESHGAPAAAPHTQSLEARMTKSTKECGPWKKDAPMCALPILASFSRGVPFTGTLWDPVMGDGDTNEDAAYVQARAHRLEAAKVEPKAAANLQPDDIAGAFDAANTGYSTTNMYIDNAELEIVPHQDTDDATMLGPKVNIKAEVRIDDVRTLNMHLLGLPMTAVVYLNCINPAQGVALEFGVQFDHKSKAFKRQKGSAEENFLKAKCKDGSKNGNSAFLLYLLPPTDKDFPNPIKRVAVAALQTVAQRIINKYLTATAGLNNILHGVVNGIANGFFSNPFDMPKDDDRSKACARSGVLGMRSKNKQQCEAEVAVLERLDQNYFGSTRLHAAVGAKVWSAHGKDTKELRNSVESGTNPETKDAHTQAYKRLLKRHKGGKQCPKRVLAQDHCHWDAAAEKGEGRCVPTRPAKHLLYDESDIAAENFLPFVLWQFIAGGRVLHKGRRDAVYIFNGEAEKVAEKAQLPHNADQLLFKPMITVNDYAFERVWLRVENYYDTLHSDGKVDASKRGGHTVLTQIEGLTAKIALGDSQKGELEKLVSDLLANVKGGLIAARDNRKAKWRFCQPNDVQKMAQDSSILSKGFQKPFCVQSSTLETICKACKTVFPRGAMCSYVCLKDYVPGILEGIIPSEPSLVEAPHYLDCPSHTADHCGINKHGGIGKFGKRQETRAWGCKAVGGQCVYDRAQEDLVGVQDTGSHESGESSIMSDVTTKT